jgi:hypothetical protein
MRIRELLPLPTIALEALVMSAAEADPPDPLAERSEPIDVPLKLTVVPWESDIGASGLEAYSLGMET